MAGFGGITLNAVYTGLKEKYMKLQKAKLTMDTLCFNRKTKTYTTFKETNVMVNACLRF